MLKKTTTIAILALLALSFSAVHADMIPLDEATQGGGNKDVSFRPWTDVSHVDYADFVITARTSIDELTPLVADATGLMGTVYIDTDGAGVQDLDEGGSEGISGGGGDRDGLGSLALDEALNAAENFVVRDPVRETLDFEFSAELAVDSSEKVQVEVEQ